MNFIQIELDGRNVMFNMDKVLLFEEKSGGGTLFLLNDMSNDRILHSTTPYMEVLKQISALRGVVR